MSSSKYHEIYHEDEMGFKVMQKPSLHFRPNKPPQINSIEYHLIKSIIRNEFVKDRDRILYSKPFRRLEHKAQIFSHEKGDHYRTRLLTLLK